jgi:hypothetical protein
VSRYHRLGGGDIDLAIVHRVLLPQIGQQNGLDDFALSYRDKTLTLTPALIAIADRNLKPTMICNPIEANGYRRLLSRHALPICVICLAGLAFLGQRAFDVKYDYNLLNLQADGLESVAVEKKLLTECDQSVWYALSIAESREQLLERKARLLELPSVERVDEIASLLPVDEDLKRPIIARIRDRLAGLPERPPEIPLDRLESLGETLAWAQGEASKRPGGLRTAWHLERARDSLRRQGPEECFRALAGFQQRAAGDLLSRLHAPDGEYIPRTYFLGADGKVDESIHAPRAQFKYFYDETNPASLLAGMEEARRKWKSM